MKVEGKRLFLGIEVHAPWPLELPAGRLLQEPLRHLTLVFLGNIPWPPMQQRLSSLPLPVFKVGQVGEFDQCLFLPERHPRVVAWHARLYDGRPLLSYQEQLAGALRSHGYSLDDRPFLPHVTLARAPFDLRGWQKAFEPLPFFTGALHLYESLGNLTYAPLWSHPLPFPFEELDHIADIAFRVRAESVPQLHLHALAALAFKCPALLPFIPQESLKNSLDEIIVSLNGLVSRLDSRIGSPFKAVSYHGEIRCDEQGLFNWEMIVDV